MRPISLTIEGLTSFRTSQQVDLSELDLFVITGPTGSGKSSILDAMTFALYGSVSRCNGNELRDLISHGSSFMRVLLDFRVDDTHYRVARRMGKNRHEATLERIEGESSVTEVEQGGIRVVNARLEEIVGLDFKAFTKAVLLPQGAFHEFLKGDVSERRRILVRLLDLGRYELVGQAARREAVRLDLIIGERNSLIQSNYADATKQQMQTNKSLLSAAKKHHATVEKAKTDGKQIALGAADAVRDKAALSQSVEHIDGSIESLNALSAAWPDIETAEADARVELERAEKLLAATRQSDEKAQKQLDRTIARTGDAASLATLEAAAAARVREHVELGRLDQQLAAARKSAIVAGANLESTDKQAREAHTTLKERRDAHVAAQARHLQASSLMRHAIAFEELARLAGELAKAQDSRARALAAVDTARQKLRHLEQDHAAVALRAGLAAGDRCPVCEVPIAVLPKSKVGIEEKLSKATTTAETAAERERTAQTVVVAFETQHAAAAKELKAAEDLIPAEVTRLDKDAAGVALAQAESDLAAAIEAVEAAQAAADAADATTASARTAVETSEVQVNGIIENRNGCVVRVETATATLEATFKRLPEDVGEEIAARRTDLLAAESARKAAATDVTTAATVVEEARNRRAAVVDSVNTFDQQFAAATAAARMACETVATRLGDIDLPPLPEPETERAMLLASWPVACAGYVAAARYATVRLGDDIGRATDKLRVLAANIGASVDGAEPDEVAAAIETAFTESHGRVIAAEKDLETLKLRIEERTKLEDDIAADRRSGALHEALARELRADRFIGFVLAESMNQLAVQASDQLKQISDGRYSLVADDGSFEVIDHHNADERRSVATLSGGETFLASLSLALALAGSLRDLAGTVGGRLDAIFIDEGFGALDPETLDVVVDALERLREGDRMVGVITHVPALAERIPSGLSVEKSAGSSRILVR